MRTAVVSDIHGNMDALKQVLLDIELSEVDEIVCLGDMVGYGPEPEAVIKQIQALRIPALMGNHELGVTDPKALSNFNPLARQSIEQTTQMLSGSSIRYIGGLDDYIVQNRFRFVHGFPPDSVTTYLFQASEDKLKRTFRQMTETVCFVGHTHILEMIAFDERGVIHKPLSRGMIKLNNKTKYIINVGSVGQPRDDNNNAKYVICDSNSSQIDVRFVPYDIEAVINKILKAGLPEAHAYRLR